MYVIIGGDGKEYGPVADTDLRKWIAEGRLNAETLAKAESDAEFRQLAAFPEFADLLGTVGAAPDASQDYSTGAGFADRDYELDIGGCVSRGWNLFKENLGTLFGSFFVAMLILMVASGVLNAALLAAVPQSWQSSVAFKLGFNVFLQAVLGLINGPLFGGVYYIFLQTLRGRPAGIGDLFVGYQRAFGQLYLGNLVVAILVGLCFVPFTIMEATKLEPILEQFRHASPTEIHDLMPQMWSAVFGVLPVFLICMIPMIYLMISWMFTLPLIIDKSMNFWPAMKASWKMVHRHWWQVFGLTVVVGLINLAGFCVCCVGLFFTVPMTTAGLMYAYETIFSRPQTG